MKIEKIEIKPMRLSFEPEFHIVVEYSYRNTCLLPLRFNGYLFLDRYRIAFLSEYEFKYGRSDNFSSTNANRNSEKRDRRIFVAPISRLAIAKLEEKRNKHPKGDLTFNLHIQFVFLESMFEGVRPKGSGDNVTLTKLIDSSLFKIVTDDLNHNVTISSSEWLHDFSPAFERSRYQVFEVPIPEFANDQSELSKRLSSAIHSLRLMEEAKLAGDWETVLKESRPVWELIRNRGEIQLILQQDELNDDSVKAFNAMVESLFNFSSKFIHRESRTKEVMPINKARKEDAELIYSLAVSLVNLLCKKIIRYK